MRQFLRLFSNRKETKRLPLIYTFICVDECMNVHSLDDRSITEWSEAWADAGWEPIVLTEKDAGRHPQYAKYKKQLENAKLPPNRWHRYLRHMAMSTQNNGGWFSDLSILPVFNSEKFNGKGIDLPNEGKLTIHDIYLHHLISGNKSAWTKITQHLIDDNEVKNDIVFLSSLMRNNSEDYKREDSVINVKHILNSDLKSNIDFGLGCSILDKKIAALVSKDNLEKFSPKEYYDALKLAVKNCSPAIYSFFEMAYDENGAPKEENSSIDVEEWKKAWKGAGWQPIVLTLEDAKRHPMFKEFEITLNSGANEKIDYEKMCFYRWLAVAASGGGWMADYDTYPLNIDPISHGYNLPNNGTFTSHCWKAPCLVSGSEAEWNRILPLMLNNLKNHNDVTWSDMFAMQEIMTDGQIKREMGNANIHEVHDPALQLDDPNNDGVKKACDATKSRLVMHFSHYSCEKAQFCHQNRGTVLTKWLNDWRRHCASE